VVAAFTQPGDYRDWVGKAPWPVLSWLAKRGELTDRAVTNDGNRLTRVGLVPTSSPISSTMPTYSCPMGDGPLTSSTPRSGHGSGPQMHAAVTRMIAWSASGSAGRDAP
jgi:hypothetical protein